MTEPVHSFGDASCIEIFEVLAKRYAAAGSGVNRAKLFGFDCLRVNGKVFAKLSGNDLVVKLPPKRVAELSTAGMAGAYHRRSASPMKAWLIVSLTDFEGVAALVDESRRFALSGK